jgi:hypothetical protein
MLPDGSFAKKKLFCAKCCKIKKLSGLVAEATVEAEAAEANVNEMIIPD